ncbi:MAG TPA: isochorismatase family protein [Anaerolineaceae bacterium]|nr:isochorismatase family protein [Anaerolineaceae bacterium]
MVSIINQKDTSEFLSYVDGWMAELPIQSLDDLVRNPEKVAIISVDVIKGFCNSGPLSSPRVAGIVDPIVGLMRKAWDKNVRHFILSQDTHEPDAEEFSAWPPHCIRGTEEAETVDEIRNLPFFDQMLLLEKNSIASGLNNDLQQWVLDHPEVESYIVVGDCSDLCTYQLAMFLRLDANERQVKRVVIVPEDCVQTYDMTVETAKEIGAFPHPGDFLHAVFLYHMAVNGIQVVRTIQ